MRGELRFPGGERLRDRDRDRDLEGDRLFLAVARKLGDFRFSDGDELSPDLEEFVAFDAVVGVIFVGDIVCVGVVGWDTVVAGVDTVFVGVF